MRMNASFSEKLKRMGPCCAVGTICTYMASKRPGVTTDVMSQTENGLKILFVIKSSLFYAPEDFILLL